MAKLDQEASVGDLVICIKGGDNVVNEGEMYIDFKGYFKGIITVPKDKMPRMTNECMSHSLREETLEEAQV